MIQIQKYLWLATLLLMGASTLIINLLVPEETWTTQSLIAAALLVISFGYFAYSPYLAPRDAVGGDAVSIASIGMVFAIGIFFIVFSGIAFLFSLNGYTKYSYISMIISIAGLGIFNLWMKASGVIIDEVAVSNKSSSKKSLWGEEFREILTTYNKSFVIENLAKLNERIPFLANDNSPFSDDINKQIKNEINYFKRNIHKFDEIKFNENLNTINCLFDKREVVIKLSRSKE